MEEARGNSIRLHLLFGTALVAFIFTGVYSPSGRRKRIVLPPRERRVTLRLDTDPVRSRARYVVPLKSHADHTSRLNRPTRFLAKNENAFSGRTTDRKDRKWVRPDKNPVPGTRTEKGSPDPANPGEKKGSAPDIKKAPDGTKATGDSLTSFSGVITDEQRALLRKNLSLFQELPEFRNLNTELLINFSNKGQLSLGTEAFRHTEYFHNMVRKISKKWFKYFPRFQHFYGLLKGGEVLVVFELDLDGKVKWTKLARTYGQPTLEKSCLIAIQGQDFGPIPDEYREKGKMKIPFLFVYKRPEKPLRMFR